MGINIRRGQVTGEDRAAKEIIGRTLQKTVQLIMFATEDNANWAAERAVRRAAYPFAEGEIQVNRKEFKHEVGDAFTLYDSDLGIDGMVCRVMRVKEGPVDSEDIVISWMEDPDYATTGATLSSGGTGGTVRDFTIVDLTHTMVVEALYRLVGEDIQVIPVAARETGLEIGYEVWVSYDGGSSYVYLKDVEFYAVYGTLVEELDVNVNTLDTTVGFNVDFDLTADATGIEVVTRPEMFADENIALIGTGNDAEIIGFETITPDAVVADRYKITNLNRGMYDSIKQTWPAGTPFWYLGIGAVQLIDHEQFLKGTTRYFKFVPYNTKFLGEQADATPMSHEFVGRAYAPYVPSNLRANGSGQNPLYQMNIALTWDPRVRGTGAGLGDPDSVVDAAPTSEGYFEIDVYVSDVKVRTVTALDVYSWTYTYAMNVADNGALASEVTFKLRNYITTGGVRYDSIHDRELTVKRNPDVTATTTTTTTTTTTSTTTTT